MIATQILSSSTECLVRINEMHRENNTHCFLSIGVQFLMLFSSVVDRMLRQMYLNWLRT